MLIHVPCMNMYHTLITYICIPHTGDPSIFGNLEPHPAVNEAVKAVLDGGSDIKVNGYPHSAGLVEARTAIAQMSSSDNCQLTHEVPCTYGRKNNSL